MKHIMKLHPAPFRLIEQGIKTIELRLNDEKRQKIQVGDEIEFVNTDDSSLTLLSRVTALHRFSSFAQLYKSLPLLQCGYTHQDVAAARPEDMDVYYSKERQAKYGVLGIEIKLIKE